MTPLLFERSPEAAHPFLRTALNELEAHATRLVVGPDLQVRYHDGMLSAGYFDNAPMTFAVATGKPFDDWFLVFVHEFCHFKQHLDDAAAFTQAGNDIQTLFDWVGGTLDLPPEEVLRCARVARDLEADCERRVLANLDAFGIAHLIDPKAYAQKANSYFNFYNYVAAHRTWYVGGREPYSLPEVWTTFPTTLVIEDGMTPAREALFALCVEPVNAGTLLTA